jgi:hypothetical protein
VTSGTSAGQTVNTARILARKKNGDYLVEVTFKDGTTVTKHRKEVTKP